MEFHVYPPNLRLISNKAVGLLRLYNKGFNIPFTIILREKTYLNEIDKLLKKRFQESTFYIRCSYGDNILPQSISSVKKYEYLFTALEQFIDASNSTKRLPFDIIIQPIFEFDCSGVALIHKEHILFEYVQNHPISLLRDGEFFYRIMLDKKLTLIDINQGLQTISYKWFGDKLLDSKDIDIKIGLDNFLNICRTINLTRVDDKNYPYLFEFIIADQKIIYVEFKNLNSSSYNMLFHKNMLIPKPFVIYKESEKCYKPKKIYTYPKLINFNPELDKYSVLVKNGAFLSHFATYCANAKIHCQFL